MHVSSYSLFVKSGILNLTFLLVIMESYIRSFQIFDNSPAMLLVEVLRD